MMEIPERTISRKTYYYSSWSFDLNSTSCISVLNIALEKLEKSEKSFINCTSENKGLWSVDRLRITHMQRSVAKINPEDSTTQKA